MGVNASNCEPISAYGLALDELVGRLTVLGRDPEVDGPVWVDAAVTAMLETPLVWPMDDGLYDMLLAFAGFSLDDGECVLSAAGLTAWLLGTRLVRLKCSHSAEDRTPLCFAVERARQGPDFDHGAQAAASPAMVHCREIRRRRAAELRRVAGRR